MARQAAEKVSAAKKSGAKSRGIPHLAKNERDMGHPGSFLGRSKKAPKSLKPENLYTERFRGFKNPLPRTKVRGWHIPGLAQGLFSFCSIFVALLFAGFSWSDLL